MNDYRDIQLPLRFPNLLELFFIMKKKIWVDERKILEKLSIESFECAITEYYVFHIPSLCFHFVFNNSEL